MKKIVMLFDTIRAPYDIANILQTYLALGNCELHFCGNSLRHDMYKVTGKVASWSGEYSKNPDIVKVIYHSDFESAARELKKQGYVLLGTSPNSDDDFYSVDFNQEDYVLCFGTEVGGFSKKKMELLDRLVKLPMTSNIDFMTLSLVAPIMAYEVYRQLYSSKS